MYKSLNSDRSDDPDRFQLTQDLSDSLASELTESDKKLKRPNPGKHFSHLFSSYSKYYNKSYNRQGSLFMKPFKRKQITTDLQFQNTLIYIHLNPVVHGFTNKANQWKYSSYNAYATQSERTIVNTKVAIESFNDITNLLECHSIKRAEQFEEE